MLVVVVNPHRCRVRQPSLVSILFSVLVVFLLTTTTTTTNAQQQQQQQKVITLTENLQRCATPEEADTVEDFFPEKFIPQDIEGNDLLEITYHKTYKIVTNHFQNKTYLLYQCGTEPPQDVIDNNGNFHIVLPVPHEGGIAVTETPQIPPLELIAKRRDIIAYFGNPIYISSPCLEYMIDVEGTVEVIYDENDPFQMNQTLIQMQRTEFFNEHPDAIVLGGPYADKDGDRVLSIAASQEKTAVATFDWIGLYGSLFNMENYSNQIASETKQRYDCSSKNAAVLSADNTEKPVVLWAMYIDGFNWSVAECPTWDAAYYCEYARHCGSNILSRPEGVGWNNPDYGGNFWYLNDNEILALGKDADVWIYPSKTFADVYETKKELFDQFKAVQNEKVYDTQGQGPQAWQEQRLAEYDVVALDFCDVVGNANPITPTHKRRWLRNIFTEPIEELDMCDVPDEIDEPYQPKGAVCTPLPGTEGGTSSSLVAFSPTVRSLHAAAAFALAYSMAFLL